MAPPIQTSDWPAISDGFRERGTRQRREHGFRHQGPDERWKHLTRSAETTDIEEDDDDEASPKLKNKDA